MELDNILKRYKEYFYLFSLLLYYFRNHKFLSLHSLKATRSMVLDRGAQLFYYESKQGHLKVDTCISGIVIINTLTSLYLILV